jgi:hypothetical protein
MKLLWLAAVSLLCLFAVACDDGDDDTSASTQTPAPTAAPEFDPAALTSTVLNADDEPGFAVSGLFNPSDPTAGGRSFTSYLSNDAITIQSSVVRFATDTAASADFQRNRLVLPTFGAQEENFQMEHAEIAFLYRLRTGPGLGMWAIIENYVMYIQMSPTDLENGDPAAVDVERMRRYANTVAGRVRALIDDPASVTPVPLDDFGAQPPEEAPAADPTPAGTPQE